MHTSKRMHFIEDQQWCSVGNGKHLHTSKRMHFIEEPTRPCTTSPPCRTCIRQNVCTSLRTSVYPRGLSHVVDLHTSKRMHFIEDARISVRGVPLYACIRQNVCTSLRRCRNGRCRCLRRSCIRQNVCTSLRIEHLDSDIRCSGPCIRQNVCTSLRINKERHYGSQQRHLAYVKTYALH